MFRSISIALILVFAFSSLAEDSKESNLAGLWKNAQEGNNSSIDFLPDGSGYYLLENFHKLAWSYNSKKSIVTIEMNTRDGEKQLRLRYDAKQDCLILIKENEEEADLRFIRADERYKRWYLEIQT